LHMVLLTFESERSTLSLSAPAYGT
jgi:hypothetical protein